MDSVCDIVTRIGTEGTGALFLAGERDFTFLQKVQNGCVAHLAPYTMGQGINGTRVEAGHSPHITSRLGWRGTTPLLTLYVFMIVM